MAGTAGVIVNKNYVSDYPHNMDIFLRSDLKGKMLLLDHRRQILGTALNKLGYSINSINPDELNQAKNLVLEWKNNIKEFHLQFNPKSLVSGDIWVIYDFPERFFYAVRDESLLEDIDFFIPEDGCPIYIDSFIIPRDANNIENAHKFISYIHIPQVYAQILDYVLLTGVNPKAINFRDTIMIYTLDDLTTLEFRKSVGKNIELYNKVWDEIKENKK
jgi:spermidine/putrescine transport system substrate-binding protein